MSAWRRAAPRLLASLALAATLPAPLRASEEVPFVTTPDSVTLAMLQLADVGAADHVIDLGSGDGRIVILAARRFGATGLGVEIVPDLVERSRANARAAGVEARARFVEQDLFRTDLSGATVVTMYLLPDVNLQLRPTLLALAPGTRVVSHDWDMGDWAPDRSISVAAPDKTIGREKLSRLHLWRVPARVEGIWCGRGSAAGAALQLGQRYQQVSGRVVDGPRLAGRLDGVALQAALEGSGELRATFGPGRLQVTQAPAALARWQGAMFEPATGSAC